MAINSVWVQEHIYTLVTVDKPQLPQYLQCLVDCEDLSQSHTAVSTHSVLRAVYSVLN